MAQARRDRRHTRKASPDRRSRRQPRAVERDPRIRRDWAFQYYQKSFEPPDASDDKPTAACIRPPEPDPSEGIP